MIKKNNDLVMKDVISTANHMIVYHALEIVNKICEIPELICNEFDQS